MKHRGCFACSFKCSRKKFIKLKIKYLECCPLFSHIVIEDLYKGLLDKLAYFDLFIYLFNNKENLNKWNLNFSNL